MELELITSMIEIEKDNLKQAGYWNDYKRLKKEYNYICECIDYKENQEENKRFFNSLKRVTILQREFLTRGKKGYYKENKEVVILYNKTDKQLEKDIEALNEGKRSRFYKVVKDFNLKSKKGIKEYKHYLVDNDLL